MFFKCLSVIIYRIADQTITSCLGCLILSTTIAADEAAEPRKDSSDFLRVVQR
jgi:hypothetical protein